MFQKTISDRQEYLRQKLALQYLQGPGVAKLLNFDDRRQILTLNYISNHSLKDLFPQQEEQSILLTCQAITSLHSRSPTEQPKSIPHLRDWCQCLIKNYGLPAELVQAGKILATKLLASTPKEILLHGDLHHENILLQDQETIVIDPKPVWGDPLFEPARFILNPIDHIVNEPNLEQLLRQRIQTFATYFGDHTHRIRDWTFVCAMIAACWHCEDQLDPTPWTTLAKIILDKEIAPR